VTRELTAPLQLSTGPMSTGRGETGSGLVNAIAVVEDGVRELVRRRGLDPVPTRPRSADWSTRLSRSTTAA
jgi:hypothetical protein